MTPFILIGGMTTGVFTPTEAAIAATVYAIILGMCIYRTLSLRSSSRSAWRRPRPRPSSS